MKSFVVDILVTLSRSYVRCVKLKQIQIWQQQKTNLYQYKSSEYKKYHKKKDTDEEKCIIQSWVIP